MWLSFVQIQKTNNLTSISLNITGNAAFFCCFRAGLAIQIKQKKPAAVLSEQISSQLLFNIL